jgi:hypothetical protein
VQWSVFYGWQQCDGATADLAISIVDPAGIGGLKIIGEQGGTGAAGVSEVGRDEGDESGQKASEMCFHAGLLDITIGKETAWARSIMVLASSIHWGFRILKS